MEKKMTYKPTEYLKHANNCRAGEDQKSRKFLRPYGTEILFTFYPTINRWAKNGRSDGTEKKMTYKPTEYLKHANNCHAGEDQKSRKVN